MYSLLRGGKCLGNFEEEGPFTPAVETRDDQGERMDAHMLVLQLHRFVTSANVEEWRTADPFDGDYPDYWTVTFASRPPDESGTTIIRQTHEPT